MGSNPVMSIGIKDESKRMRGQEMLKLSKAFLECFSCKIFSIQEFGWEGEIGKNVGEVRWATSCGHNLKCLTDSCMN